MPAAIDLTNERFGRLLVLAFDSNGATGKRQWRCRCDCGAVVVVTSCSLRTGNTRSCGCLKRDTEVIRNAFDLTGERYGRLVALRREVLSVRGRRQGRWRCRCDCGAETVVVTQALRNGNTRSCGCLDRDAKAQRAWRHGMAKTPTYSSWCAMHTRCTNARVPSYGRYGGRGISICDRWQGPNGFEHFLDDMGERPSLSHSLERIDNNGHYEPGNCRWATPREQANNCRRNILITYQGRTQTLAQWARETGLSYDALKRRLRLGWSPEDILGLPSMNVPKTSVARRCNEGAPK